MNNYVSPVIFDNDELAEGVYATGSGAADCWTVTGRTFHQAPEVGMNCFVLQLDAEHHANDHSSAIQEFVLTFSAPVRYNTDKSSTLSYVSGDGTNTLRLKRINHANGTDNFGCGDIYVWCDTPSVTFIGGRVDCTHE